MRNMKKKSFEFEGRSFKIQTIVDEEFNVDTIFCDFCIKGLEIRQKFFEGVPEDLRARKIDQFFGGFKKKVELVYPNCLAVFNYPMTSNATWHYKSPTVEVMMSLAIYIPVQKFVKGRFFEGWRDEVIGMVRDITRELKCEVNGVGVV